MRFSILTIAFAAVAVPTFAVEEPVLATEADVTTSSETLAVAKELDAEITAVEAEITKAEAELAEYQTTDGSTGTITDGPTDTTDTTDTTDEKTLTTDPCPLRAIVECDVGMVMIKEENPISPDCPDYKCVPNLCAGTEDLSLNADGLRCELHLTKDTEGSCYEYSCERKFCDGAEDLTSDSMKCTAGLTSEGCYDYHCEQIAVDPNYCLDSLIPETDTTCQGDYVKTEGEGGCIMINCYVPCTPTCSGGTKALISDATTCKYECVKKGGKTRDGGDDGTDGGGGKTKVCKGRNCRRKNLRA